MTKALAPPIRRRNPITLMSKPERSRLILVATTAIIATVLAIWILKRLLDNESGQLAALWVRYAGPSAPFLPFRDADAQTIGHGHPVADAAPSALKERVAEVLGRRAGRPIIVYLSAPGVSLGDRDVFLPNDPDEALRLLAAGPEPADLPGAVKGVLDVFAANTTSKKLLILDAGQIGTDRDLGVFGNGFLAHLAATLGEKPWKDRSDIAVLCACAPGQTSWTSEADRRTIFGYFVARGLAGAAKEWDRGQLSVQGLARYVTAQVKRWAIDHRQARQTPILLGNSALDFPLEGLLTVPEPPERTSQEEKAEKALLARLEAEWKARDALDDPHGARPYRRSPLGWRRYLDGLLRAERLYRAGQIVEAGEVLSDLESLRQGLVHLAGGYPVDANGRLWSLALVERQLIADPKRRAELDAGWQAIDAAAADLLRDDAAAKAVGVGPAESLRPSQVAPAESVLQASERPRPRTDAVADKKGADKKEADKKAAAKDEPPAVPEGGAGNGKGEAIDKAEGQVAARPAPRTEPPGLLDTQRVGRGQPRYLEGQLLAWAFAFRRLDGAPELQRDTLEAFRVRALAERAAAADERILRWVAPLIEQADARRRQAQDHLFLGGRRPEAGTDPFRNAADQYDRIITDYASMTCEPALDLVQKITAELPYYAEWAGRTGEAPADALLAQVEALAKAIDAGPQRDHGDGPAHPAKESELDQLVEEIRALWDHYSRLRTSYESLTQSFLERCRQNKGNNGRGKFRAVDALLRVPVIPAATRMQLLARVRSAELSPSMTRTAIGPADAEPTDSTASEDAAAVEPEPQYWDQAQIQGRVELTLLRLGGASTDETFEAARALDNAHAVRKDPARAFGAYARFSDEVRAARSRLRARVEKMSAAGDLATIADERRVADRAARVLPPIYVETFGLEDDRAPDRRLARLLRAEQLRWHGRRLIEDFAPAHAMQLIRASRLLVESREVIADEALAQQVEKARLEIATVPADKIHVSASALKMKLRVTADKDVPAGETTILVGNRDPDNLLVVIHPPNAQDPVHSSHDRAATALVNVPTDSDGLALPCTLRRGSFGAGNLRASIVPTMFYRGQAVLTRITPVAVALDATKEEVTITMRQEPSSIPKGYRDQFLVHPNLGAMHYGTILYYIVDLTNNTDEARKIKLVGRFDGAPSSDEASVELKPHESTRTWPREKWISGLVATLDKEFDTKKPPEGQAFKIRPEEVPRHRDRSLTLNAFENDGSPNRRSLSVERQIVFRQLEVEDYATAEAYYSPDDKMVYVTVLHRGNDPVQGPLLKVGARVLHMFQDSNPRYPIKHGNGWRFWFPVESPDLNEIKCYVDIGYKKQAFVREIKLREKPTAPPGAKKDKDAAAGGDAP